MAGIDVSLDTEAVQVVVNLIADRIEEFSKLNNDFTAQVEEALVVSNNRFEPLRQLKEKVNDETANIKAIVEAMENTKDVIDRYADLAAQANDTSYFA